MLSKYFWKAIKTQQIVITLYRLLWAEQVARFYCANPWHCREIRQSLVCQVHFRGPLRVSSRKFPRAVGPFVGILDHIIMLCVQLLTNISWLQKYIFRRCRFDTYNSADTPKCVLKVGPLEARRLRGHTVRRGASFLELKKQQ